MNKSELRIGNLVQLDPTRDWIPKDSDHTMIVESISEEGINYTMEYASNPDWRDFDDLVGIPLDEDWLNRLGFRRRFNTESCNLFDIERPEDKEQHADRGQSHICLADFMHKHGWYLDCGSRRTLKYVHELQNLFHAITGDELKIKVE